MNIPALYMRKELLSLQQATAIYKMAASRLNQFERQPLDEDVLDAIQTDVGR